MTANEEGTKETWTCMGRRLRNGKVFYAWDDGQGGDTRYFQKLKGQPGRRYTVTVYERDDEGALSVSQSNAYVDSLDVDDPKRIEWEAIERSDMTQGAIDSIEKRDKGVSALAELCAPLHDLYRKQVGPSRRAAFLAVVTEMVTR